MSCLNEQEHAPVLHGFLVWDMRHAEHTLSNKAYPLLKRLLRLAKAAYVPAPLDKFKGCAKRISNCLNADANLNMQTGDRCFTPRTHLPFKCNMSMAEIARWPDSCSLRL